MAQISPSLIPSHIRATPLIPSSPKPTIATPKTLHSNADAAPSPIVTMHGQSGSSPLQSSRCNRCLPGWHTRVLTVAFHSGRVGRERESWMAGTYAERGRGEGDKGGMGEGDGAGGVGRPTRAKWRNNSGGRWVAAFGRGTMKQNIEHGETGDLWLSGSKIQSKTNVEALW